MEAICSGIEDLLLFFFLKQVLRLGPTSQSSLAWNLSSPFAALSSAEITGMRHHACFTQKSLETWEALGA